MCFLIGAQNILTYWKHFDGEVENSKKLDDEVSGNGVPGRLDLLRKTDL